MLRWLAVLGCVLLLGCVEEVSPTRGAPDVLDAGDARDAGAVIDARDAGALIDVRDAGALLDASEVAERVDQPTNRTCATAAALPASTGLSALLAFGGEAPACAPGSLPALWYRVRVPAGHRITAQLFDLSPLRVGATVRLLHTCGGACLASSPSAGLAFVTWVNDGADADVLLALSPDASTFEGEAQLLVGVQAPPANATCASATTLRDGGYLADEPARSLAPAPTCLGRDGWRATYYRTTVPAHQSLVLTGHAAPAPVAYALLDDCAATTCLATATPVGAESVLRYDNASDAPRAMVIAVATPATPADARVSSLVSIGAVAPNASCGTATRVVDGAALTGQRPLFAREPSRACGDATGETGALYYAARVEAGDELIVTARKTIGAEGAVRLRLLGACDATACLAYAEETALSVTRLAWVNASAEAREVVLALSLSGALSHASVELAVTTRRQRYAASAIVARCDDMSGAARFEVARGILGQEERRSLPLPFAFSWYGETLRHWTASPAGYLELWPEAGTARPSTPGPGLLPSVALPPNVLAPFWESFTLDAQRAMSWRVVDGPRRHLAVQWTNVQLASATDAPITFQAWVLEDGSAEFHYCAMGASARATGGGASIGAQGGAGPQGLTYAFRRAGAAPTGTGIRIGP